MKITNNEETHTQVDISNEDSSTDFGLHLIKEFLGNPQTTQPWLLVALHKFTVRLHS